MLSFSPILFIWALNSVGGAEHHLYVPRFVKLKRGIADTGHAPQVYKFHGPKSLSYKDAKIIPQESLIGGSSSSILGDFKPSVPYTSLPESQSSEQLSPYSDSLYTMSAGYKIANDNTAKPLIQTSLQVPLYKTNYPLPKATVSQMYAPALQSKKAPLQIFQMQKGQEFPGYLSSFQRQPLVLNPGNHQFNYPGRTPKVNNVQLSAPFLSPLSSFQGEVVPISTATNNPQFPQYKGAAVELYPAVGGFSTVAYQPLQAQPQLHFAHGNVQHVQPVENPRHSKPVQEIRSDVEIINRKKPARPPPKEDGDDDEDDDGDDEGYRPRGKQYEGNSEDDDNYETKSGSFFKASTTEGDFKPSTSFPFKQYDEKFGKYSKQNRDEGTDEKPYSKYHSYSSSNDDSDDELVSSGKYHAEDTSSKPFYNRQEDDEDDEHGYEKQRTDESSDNTQGSKYFDKDFDEDFEASYRRESPKQRYGHVKEVPEVEYGSRSSRRNKDNYESDEPSGERSRTNAKYRKNFQNFKDNEGHNSDILISAIPETIYKESFGYKLPQGNDKF